MGIPTGAESDVQMVISGMIINALNVINVNVLTDRLLFITQIIKSYAIIAQMGVNNVALVRKQFL
jgi:hypothetical protein